MHCNPIFRNGIIASLAILWMSQALFAAPTQSYNVSLDTASLTSDISDQPFALLVQLNSGGTPNVSNTVTLSNFNFAGGSVGDPGSEQSQGNVSGDLSSQLALDTSNGGFNLFSENFNPGSTLSFVLTTTDDSVDATVDTPDEFSLQILDAAGNPIPTMDPSSADSQLTFTYSQPLDIEAYGSDTSRTTTTNQTLAFAAPVITAVPEPSCLVMALILPVLLNRPRKSR